MLTRGASWVLALGLTAMATTAVAQDDERGRLHFQAGASYYEAGEYEAALREFQRAYELSERPQLFYNFSLCYQQLDQYERAVDYLSRYLQEVEDVPNRGNLERRLENLRERAAERRAREAELARASEANAGATTEAEEPVEPRPEPSAEPQEETEQTPSAVSPVPEAASGPPATEPSPSRGIPTASIISFGAAGVGAITMTLFGVLALGEQSSIEDGCGATTSCTEDEVSTLDTYALLSDVGLGVAVVGAALGVTLLFTGGGDAEERPMAVRVTPYANGDGGGAVVGGRF